MLILYICLNKIKTKYGSIELFLTFVIAQQLSTQSLNVFLKYKYYKIYFLIKKIHKKILKPLRNSIILPKLYYLYLGY